MTGMEVNLKGQKKALYAKLFIAEGDLWYAGRCLSEIIKNKWHLKSLDRRRVYFKLSVYTTTMVVLYYNSFPISKHFSRVVGVE